ncbi:calcium/sodium antiporter [Aquipuribacter sp. MA13-6]|uniref:calcium/sodium antiporter n=1 Tax=unclassified Aquipuribacter TaxID=2635084 RepID=UPI003EECBBFC
MDVLTIVLLVVGLAVLVGGGELLVRGASGLATALGLSPLLVGLTVVSFATSAPELAVSLRATLSGNPGLAVGNVVGSNIANVLLVLGLSAVVLPLVVRTRLVRTDVPVMIGLSVLTLLLALDGWISRLDGVLLVVLLVGYVSVSVVVSRRQERAGRERVARQREAGGDSPGTSGPPAARTGARTALDAGLVAVGVGLLVLGATLLVDSATTIGSALGVSDLVIGLTVVAVGTSLPELATSIIAAVRGQRDMAVGNVVGSNIFNIGAVLGLSGVISPVGIELSPGAVNLDLPVMILVAVALLPVAITGAAVARWEGLLFVAYYAVYVTYLVLDSTGHDALGTFNGVVAGFLLPLTGIVLLVLVSTELDRRRRRRLAAAEPTSAGADAGRDAAGGDPAPRGRLDP